MTRRSQAGRPQQYEARAQSELFTELQTVESARQQEDAADPPLAALLHISCNAYAFDTRPPLDAKAQATDTVREDEATAERLEAYRNRCRQLERAESATPSSALSGVLLADFSLRLVPVAALPVGVDAAAMPLMTVLTLSFVPADRQLALLSPGLAGKGGRRTQPVGQGIPREEARYTVTCMFPTAGAKERVCVPDRLQRHVAVGRLFEDSPHLLKVLAAFTDVVDDENVPRGVDPARFGQPCVVAVTHAFTHTLSQELDRRSRLRHGRLTAAGVDVSAVATEDLPPLLPEGLLMCYAHQLCAGLLHLMRAAVPIPLMNLTADSVFLNRRLDTPSHTSWDTMLMIGVFAGTTPSDMLYLSPAGAAVQALGPRLNTEGRSGGLSGVVSQLLGGVDPLHFVSDSAVGYSRRACRLLTHLIEEDWDVQVALQHLTLHLFGDPHRGPSALLAPETDNDRHY